MANSWHAPVSPVVSHQVVDPEEGVGVPCIDVEAESTLDDPIWFVVVVAVGAVGIGAGRMCIRSPLRFQSRTIFS